MNVGKLSHRSHNLLIIREHTQGRNPTNVLSVENPSTISQPYKFIRGSIQKRNPINVLNVGNPSAISQPDYTSSIPYRKETLCL